MESDKSIIWIYTSSKMSSYFHYFFGRWWL
jgi:hypothetical protein